MPIIKTTPSFLPRCPYCNHQLEDVGFPIPQKGQGYCPAGGGYYAFEVEVDQSQMVKDKNGNLTKKVGWKVTGEPHKKNDDN